MKTKPFDKKLVLNKKTIAHLDNDKMNAVQGGMPTCITNMNITSCFTKTYIICD
jgi:hypothetical protein